MPLHIVLLEPEIPNNTGNIGRLSLASGCHLHLIKPLGFDLDSKRVKRAGLDYWKHVQLHIHENWQDFRKAHPDAHLSYFSSHGTKSIWNLPFEEDTFLVFGKESVGLPKELVEQNTENCYSIPVMSTHVRSLNLANAVSVAVYEGMRQLKSK